MKKSIAELAGLFKGEEIFVIGSGATVDYYTEGLFKGKRIIGVNYTYNKIKPDFCVFTHLGEFKNAIGKVRCVVSEFDMSENSNTPNDIITDEDYYIFSMGGSFCFDKNLADVGLTDKLCMGNTIIIPAINFAAHLGASCIFLVGVDCAAVNGRINYKGYNNNWRSNPAPREQIRFYINDLFIRNAKEIFELNKALLARYGCQVITLSPFVGLKHFGAYVTDQMSKAEYERILEQE